MIIDHDAIRKHLHWVRKHSIALDCPCAAHDLELVPDLFELLRRSQYLGQVLASLADLTGRVPLPIVDEDGTEHATLCRTVVPQQAWWIARSIVTDARKAGWLPEQVGVLHVAD